MDRRGFLSLSVRRRRRVLELSCERLYMRWVDAQAAEGTVPADAAGAPGVSADSAGEPPTRQSVPGTEALLADLDARLAEADVLRVLDSDWLTDDWLEREIAARIVAFRRRGGEVEYERGSARVGPRVVAMLLFGLAAFAAPLAAQSVPDDVLRARIEAALATASDLPADSLAVRVEGGVVTLSGSVVCEACGGVATPPGTATVQQSLGAVVRAVPGVREVRFRLAYEPPAPAGGR